MELCRADIVRLERRGHLTQDFLIIGEDGIPRLRNVDGHCVFFDVERKRCREYASRPLGCSIYPVNLTEDDEVIVDEICPEGATLTREEIKDKAARLRRLLATIDSEARKNLVR